MRQVGDTLSIPHRHAPSFQCKIRTQPSVGDEYFGQKAVDFGHHPPKTHVSTYITLLSK